MVRPQFKRNGEIDRQLEDLVKASSWKQAIALCEKRIKKGDKSDAALVTKAHVLLACPDLARQHQGAGELGKLIGRDPPILDVDVLRSLYLFSNHRKASQDLLGPLWARAAKARPQDESIVKTWFETMFQTQRYKEAQKAAITYRTQFPRSHQAHFWYIITCYLLAESKNTEEAVRRMNQGLAFQNLAKAAKAVVAEGPSSSGLVLENLEDLLLLVRVYRSQNKFKEALNVLDDDRTGIISRIGNKEWQLLRQKVELFALSGQWQDMWQLCRTILSGSHSRTLVQESTPLGSAFRKVGDDWMIWNGLVNAASQIHSEKIFTQAEARIDSFADFSRNARIARLKLYASYPDESANLKSKLFKACQEHFADFLTKYVCFLDLSPYLPSLERKHQVELVEAAARHSRGLAPRPSDSEAKAIQWITSEVNVLKLHYSLSIAKYPGNSSRPLLESFTCRCLRLYKLSLLQGEDQPVSERRAGDDAAMLAVMALMHVADFGDDAAVLRCVFILETLLIKSPHNYDALLILIRLCLVTGTSSLAMEHYMQLSIKNMQHATLSWILYTHISLLHPYSPKVQTKSKEALAVMDLPENITAALNWHAVAAQLNSDYICTMLQEGRHNMVLDSLALNKSLSTGFARLLLLVGWVRIQRLTGALSPRDYSDFLDDFGGQVEENRDTNIFPNYEGKNNSLFEGRFDHGISVDIRWLFRQLYIIKAWDALDGSGHINTNFLTNTCEGDSSEEKPEPDASMETILEYGLLISRSYKSSEKLEAARKAIMGALEKIASFHGRAASVLESMKDEPKGFFIFLQPKFTAPSAAYFRHHFGLLDICHCVRKVVDRVRALNEGHELVEPVSMLGISARITDGYRSLALEAGEQALAMQRRLQHECSARDIIAGVFDGQSGQQDPVGMELRSTIGQPNMAEIAEDLRQSWIEALDGIVRAARYLGGN